jgi:hypothetical protein
MVAARKINKELALDPTIPFLGYINKRLENKDSNIFIPQCTLTLFTIIKRWTEIPKYATVVYTYNGLLPGL